MNEAISLPEVQPVVPTRASALSRGRSDLADRLLLTRRRRRRLIREIEAETQRALLSYVSEGGSIMREDVLYLETLLQGVEPGDNVTLLLNSPRRRPGRGGKTAAHAEGDRVTSRFPDTW